MATTENGLRRELLVGIRDNELAITALLAIAIAQINAAARKNKNNPKRFERDAVQAIVVFWAGYQLLSKKSNRVVATAFAEYVDATVGVQLDKVGATKTLAKVTKITNNYADDVFKGVLTRRNAFDNLTINQRITTLKRGSERVVRGLLNIGLNNDMSINQIARSIQHYIDPASPTGKRFTRGNGTDYRTVPTGRNLPKGSIRYNAVRIARTEMMHTYDIAAKDFFDKQPWGGLWDWFTSNSHKHADFCDVLQSQNPHNRLPDRPHPQCTCNPRPRVPSLKEFEQLVKSGKIQ